MGRGKIGLIRLWGLVWFNLVYLTRQTISSKDESKTCNPSHCGIITNISYPFRLRDDPPNCGLRPFELACESNVTLLHLHSGTSSSTYQVLGINYHNYTVRLRDPGIREGDCSSLPRYSLSRSNFSDTYNYSVSYDYGSNHPYHADLQLVYGSELTFEHVIYLNCSDPMRDDAGYVDTAACVDWGSKGEGGGYVYAVAGEDLAADKLKPECRVKSVATIASYWRSFFKGKTYSYADIHTVLSHGFEISWWPLACSDQPCANDGACYFDTNKRKLSCYGRYTGSYFSLFCVFLSGILAGFPSAKSIHQLALDIYTKIDTTSFFGGFIISITAAFRLGKITGRYVLPSIIILRFLFGILFLFILLVYTYRRRHLSVYESIEDFIRLHDLHPLRYSYKDLKTMTKGFKTRIGEGGFGTVYKGKLRSGSEVAIKMLGKSKATGQEFINEVATIGRIHHFNVVRLVGFCVEGTKHALIYEFMSNGSLDKHIFFKEGHISLSYLKIYEISLGIARGIAYLHHGCDMQIWHFDIKPHNILLDDKLIPKISDFGLARLYFVNDSVATLTAVRGTIGYMAPELFYKNVGKVSHKCDVYSFRMLLMEMASRRRNSNPHAEHSSQLYFPLWIYDQFHKEKDIEMEDLTEEEKYLVKKMFIVALWCIQFNSADRPSMNNIIAMLEADDVESLEMPPKLCIYPDDDIPNFDQTTSLFSESSQGNPGEDASEDDKK